MLGLYLRLTLIEDNAGLLLEIGFYVVDNTCGGLLLMHCWALGRWPFSKGSGSFLPEAALLWVPFPVVDFRSVAGSLREWYAARFVDLVRFLC